MENKFNSMLIANKAVAMANRPESKSVEFSTLTKVEKLSYYEATQAKPETLSDEREIKVSNLTKDMKLQCMYEAMKKGDTATAAAIMENSESVSVSVVVSVPYDKASIKAKLNYYSKIEHPETIEKPVLGGVNLLEFCKYVVENWDTIYKGQNENEESENEE